MEKKSIILSRETLIPVGVAIAVLLTLGSAIYWVSSWMSTTGSSVEYMKESFRDFQTEFESRLRFVENEQNAQKEIQARTEEKLKSIDENVKTLKDTDIKELRDDVKKLLTAPQYRAAQ